MMPSNKSRSRRLRKKLRTGEFKELGVQFSADFKESLAAGAEDTLVDLFLAEVIEPRMLAFGGWITGGFITCIGRGSVSDEDRAQIASWFQSRPEFRSVRVGPLVDAWYDFEAG